LPTPDAEAADEAGIACATSKKKRGRLAA